LSNFFLKRLSALSIDSFSLMLIMIIAVHLLSDCKCTGYLFNCKAKSKNWSTANGPPQIAICQQLTDHSPPPIGFVETKRNKTTIDGGPLTVSSGLLTVSCWRSLYW
jgi:hypothetical protein